MSVWERDGVVGTCRCGSEGGCGKMPVRSGIGCGKCSSGKGCRLWEDANVRQTAGKRVWELGRLRENGSVCMEQG